MKSYGQPGETSSRKEKTPRREKKEKKEKKEEKEKDEEKEGKKDQLFLPEPDDSQTYVPEIFRCSECGYEQDEPGKCPDHDETELIMVRSKGRNPLEPPEVDGNEDIAVDFPLTNLMFKKTVAVVASGAVPVSPGSQAGAPSSVGVAPQSSPAPTPAQPDKK